MDVVDTHPFVFNHAKTMIEDLCKSSNISRI